MIDRELSVAGAVTTKPGDALREGAIRRSVVAVIRPAVNSRSSV